MVLYLGEELPYKGTLSGEESCLIRVPCGPLSAR